MRCIGIGVIIFMISASLKAQGFYTADTIQTIELSFGFQNWDYRLDTSKSGSDNYLLADWVKINGTVLDSVGVKYKGNSSYDSTFLKNPLHIELNTFKSHNYSGFTDIKLGNAYADPSMMREVISYHLLGNYMDCPEANFAKVYINGVYMGLYSNVESINKGFCRNHFFGDDGVLIKGNPVLTPSPSNKSNLRYISGGDSSSYFPFYELKSDQGWKALEKLCDTVSNYPSKLGSVLNVNACLWMLAFNMVFVNLDSYSGAFAQNYYLYSKNKTLFSPVLWDLNMNFGGFPFLGNSNTSLGSLSISGMQSMPLNIHANDTYWPLIKAVQGNASLKKAFVAHVKTISKECLEDSLYLSLYRKYYQLIDASVLSDSKKFFSYSQFQNALNTNISVGTYSVPGIQSLMAGRLLYFQATTEFTAVAPDIQQVQTSNNPAIGSLLHFNAQISNASMAVLYYRYSSAEVFTSTLLYDDGQHNDGAAGDLVYGTQITLFKPRLQYYVYAENAIAAKFAPQRAAFDFFELNLFAKPQKGTVVINEFLADNKSDVRNEYNMLADWVEVYNNSNSTVSLYDYYLSNSMNDRTRFVFPSTATLAPHDYLVVWADEITQGGSQLHANYKLSAEGGELVLNNGCSEILDHYVYSGQEEDRSMGRCPDGNGSFKVLNYPSYNTVNCVLGSGEMSMYEPNLKIHPNPAGSTFFIDSTLPNGSVFKIYNSLGRLKVSFPNSENLSVDCSTWENGLYFVQAGTSCVKLIINH